MQSDFFLKNQQKVKVIEPNLKYLESFVVYINDLAKEDTFLTFDPNKHYTVELERSYLESQKQQIDLKQALAYWVLDEDRVIGSADIIKVNNIRENHKATLGIMVDKNYRNLGVGSLLLEQILLNAHLISVDQVVLNLFEENISAINLYKKFGFKKFGLLPEGVFRKGKYSNLIYMYKNLS